MKFVTSQNNILRALTLVLGGVSKTTGIFSNVKIKAEKQSGIVILETTNLDIAIKTTINSIIEEDGELCVDVVKLSEIIKTFPQSVDINFESKKENILNINHGKSKFQVRGVNSEDYPKPELSDFESALKIMSKKLLYLIDKTKFSIYPNETRFNLHGLLLHFKKEDGKNLLTAVATDGHRLSLAKLEVEKDVPSDIKIIIPKKTILELKKALDTLEDHEMEIRIMKKQVVFEMSGYTLITKVVDAEFPEYEKVIPFENEKLITAPRKDLIKLVERVGAIYTTSHDSPIKLTFENDFVTLFASSKIDGEATDELSIQAEILEKVEVNYNFAYLIEILNHISSEKVRFFLKDGKPGLIKDEALESYFYVLMPMRF